MGHYTDRIGLNQYNNNHIFFFDSSLAESVIENAKTLATGVKRVAR